MRKEFGKCHVTEGFAQCHATKRFEVWQIARSHGYLHNVVRQVCSYAVPGDKEVWAVLGHMAISTMSSASLFVPSAGWQRDLSLKAKYGRKNVDIHTAENLQKQATLFRNFLTNSYNVNSDLFTLVWPIHTLQHFFFLLGDNMPFSNTVTIFNFSLVSFIDVYPISPKIFPS